MLCCGNRTEGAHTPAAAGLSLGSATSRARADNLPVPPFQIHLNDSRGLQEYPSSAIEPSNS